MRRKSLMSVLLSLLVSLFVLSVVSNVLTGYLEPLLLPEEPKRPSENGAEEEPSVLLFKVSPVTPQLFWSIYTADSYTGFEWRRTTEEKVVEEFPQHQKANATKVFTVEINTSQREILLPFPSANSTLRSIFLTQAEGFAFRLDPVGNVRKIVRIPQVENVRLVYNVSWPKIEVEDRLVLFDSIPEDIQNKYLQLPSVPVQVWDLAENLMDSSYNGLDQVLADVQFLRTNFVYDVEHSGRLYDSVRQGSDVGSYITRRKGICLDAATALAVILRIQKIPARVSVGFKPGRIEDGKLLYYSSGAHAVTEVYLPPFGWVQFDATPPLEEDPLVRMLPFKRLSPSGNSFFYQLSITNRLGSADGFRLFTHSKQKWMIEAAPKELKIEPFGTADALLQVTVPDDASLGDKDVVTLTVASVNRSDVAFSTVSVVQVGDVPLVSTTTTLDDMDKGVVRGDAFWVNGTVLTATSEQVDNMTVFVFLTIGRLADGMIIGRGHSQKGIFQIRSRVPYSLEVGDYKVVPISVGTTQYAASSKESLMRVRATTEIRIYSGNEFVLGYGAIVGSLLWDNGVGFANAPISIRIASLDAPSQVREFQNATFKDGLFSIGTDFGNPGLYEIVATFSGNEYVLGSNATHTVRMKRGVPVIQISSEGNAVRGEIFKITGTVRFEQIAVSEESLKVAFDNKPLVTIETGLDGSFSWMFNVSSEERLEPHTITVTLNRDNASTVQMVIVKSKTTLTVETHDVAGGAFLVLSTSLSDDHNMPIQGARIAVDDYGLSGRTDKNGSLTFLLDPVKFWLGNLTMVARFEGSEFYLPAMTKNEIVSHPVNSLTFILPLVLPTLALMGIAGAKPLVQRLTARKMTQMVAAIETQIEEEPVQTIPLRSALEIVLPDIEGPFPQVWGVKERLRIKIVLDASVLEEARDKLVEVHINEEPLVSIELSERGNVEFSHVFTEKGEYRIRAIMHRAYGFPPWTAEEARLRVVDYGEEIVRLYNGFVEKLARYGILAQKEMTALEIYSLALGAGVFSRQALRNVTLCFEKAEYSNHSVTRKDYETMYLSLKELDIVVE